MRDLSRKVIHWPLMIMVLLAGSSVAQQQDEAVQTVSEEAAAAFDATLADIAVYETEIALLNERLESIEGFSATIIETRRDRVWAAMFEATIDMAEDVAELQDRNVDVSAYHGAVVSELQEQFSAAYETLNRSRDQVEFPSDDQPPERFVVNDQKLFRLIQAVDEIVRSLIRYLMLADRLGLESEGVRDYLENYLRESAANRSVFLELASNDVSILRDTVVTLPDNSELAQWLRAAETRVGLSAASVQGVIEMMGELDLETRMYRKQVLTVTGEITADVLDVGIMANLFAEWSRRAATLAKSDGPRIVFQLLLIVFVLFVFFHLAKLARKGTERALRSNRVRISHLLRSMIISLVGNIVILIGVLIALGQVGVSLGPLLAGLGIVGFIVGFALQDTLSNFASGVMILFYRPFDVGDVVDAGGVRGKVSHMSLVNTTFMTLDNQKLIVPNNMIWGAVITNVTAQRIRRIDLVFDVGYDDDIEDVERILDDIVENHEAVLDDPEPVIRVSALAESSVQFIVRPWVKTGDYWEAYWDLVRSVKLRFDKEGITIPYPHRSLQITEKD